MFLDVNECHEEGICPTPGKCVNLLGSYRCVCPRGFRLDVTGGQCVDRDECDDGRCQSPCRNYAGGYRCECPSGKYYSRILLFPGGSAFFNYISKGYINIYFELTQGILYRNVYDCNTLGMKLFVFKITYSWGP